MTLLLYPLIFPSLGASQRIQDDIRLFNFNTWVLDDSEQFNDHLPPGIYYGDVTIDLKFFFWTLCTRTNTTFLIFKDLGQEWHRMMLKVFLKYLTEYNHLN